MDKFVKAFWIKAEGEDEDEGDQRDYAPISPEKEKQVKLYEDIKAAMDTLHRLLMHNVDNDSSWEENHQEYFRKYLKTMESVLDKYDTPEEKARRFKFWYGE
jgi:hypothetical protein